MWSLRAVTYSTLHGYREWPRQISFFLSLFSVGVIVDVSLLKYLFFVCARVCGAKSAECVAFSTSRSLLSLCWRHDTCFHCAFTNTCSATQCWVSKGRIVVLQHTPHPRPAALPPPHKKMQKSPRLFTNCIHFRIFLKMVQ